MNFKDLNLKKPLLDALEKSGYTEPTDIQKKAILPIIEGKDVLGCAQTGTGKTAAFALPILDKLLENDISGKKEIRALVLTPTRELAIQVRDNFRKYSEFTNLKSGVVLGGVNQKSQEAVLKKGVDILVATPGRLLDLINQRIVKLNNLDILVLDEADIMLDMGFINDVKKIIKSAKEEKQTLLFSATMPNEVKTLANTILKNHVSISVETETATVEKIDQSLYYVDKQNKTSLLMDILNENEIKSALIFTRTKHGANKLTKSINSMGIRSEVIHGNKSQSARVMALNNFKTGKSKVLIATDIASRGIDISELSHVINYEMPEKAETYVHRIGRTGRAGFSGTAISLCNIDEKKGVQVIERLTNQPITEQENSKYPMKHFELTPKKNTFNNKNNNRSRRPGKSISQNTKYR